VRSGYFERFDQGWLYLPEMFTISVVLGAYMALADPGLLPERHTG
jgi:hypothetical protein